MTGVDPVAPAPATPWYRNPGWVAALLAVVTLVSGIVTNEAHGSSQLADHARQLALLWVRGNDVPKIYADVSALRQHAEDEEKRLDEMDRKLDRMLERSGS